MSGHWKIVLEALQHLYLSVTILGCGAYQSLETGIIPGLHAVSLLVTGYGVDAARLRYTANPERTTESECQMLYTLAVWPHNASLR